MAKIAVIFGSTTGNTRAAAERIAEALGGVDLIPADRKGLSLLSGYDVLLLGSSTWGFGELQDDWEVLAGELGALDLRGKRVSFFGTGDQEGYGDTYADALGILYDALADTGAEFIGSWPTEGYTFTESRAVRGGSFIGLALDEDNQADLTADRIDRWVSLIRESTG